MTILKSILLLAIIAFSFSVDAVEVYKYKDKSGRVIFTDKPVDSAEKIEIKYSNKAKTHEDKGELIYEEDCTQNVVKNRICSIKVLEKRSDFAMVRVRYHYIKGVEHSNTIVVKANKGSHDNTVGTRGGFDIIEGDNTIDIPFGMYKAGIYTEQRPYISNYIMVKAQGITKDGKRYTSPHIFQVYAKYERPWYTSGEDTSWQKSNNIEYAINIKRSNPEYGANIPKELCVNEIVSPCVMSTRLLMFPVKDINGIRAKLNSPAWTALNNQAGRGREIWSFNLCQERWKKGKVCAEVNGYVVIFKNKAIFYAFYKD